MVDSQFDTKRFCDIMRQGELKDEDKEIFDTPGKRYLRERVIDPIMNMRPLLLREIDFSAFTEDDITNIIDIRGKYIENSYYLVMHIVKEITEARPLVCKGKIYF